MLKKIVYQCVSYCPSNSTVGFNEWEILKNAFLTVTVNKNNTELHFELKQQHEDVSDFKPTREPAASLWPSKLINQMQAKLLNFNVTYLIWVSKLKLDIVSFTYISSWSYSKHCLFPNSSRLQNNHLHIL